MFAATSFGPALHFIQAHSGPTFGWPGILTGAVHRSSVRRAFISLAGVVVQFRWTTLTVVVVLALARDELSGQTVTLGLALAAAVVGIEGRESELFR